MPQCAFRNCKNNYRNSNISAGISQFRFPSDPIRCSQWIPVVATERAEDFYQPAKFSVICSKHFDDFDTSVNSKRRRLLKTAVPKLKIGSLVTSNSISDIEVNDEAIKIPEKKSDQTALISKKDLCSSQALETMSKEPRKNFFNNPLPTNSSDIKRKPKANNNLQKINKNIEKANIVKIYSIFT